MTPADLRARARVLGALLPHRTMGQRADDPRRGQRRRRAAGDGLSHRWGGGARGGAACREPRRVSAGMGWTVGEPRRVDWQADRDPHPGLWWAG